MNSIDYSDIEQRKLQLITMITQLYDLDLLDAIENLFLTNKKDWWQSLSQEEQKAIDAGLDDIKNGKLLSNDQVMKEINERYKHLE